MNVHVTLNDLPAINARIELRRGGEPSSCEITLPPGRAPQCGDPLVITLADAAGARTLRQFLCDEVRHHGDGRVLVRGRDRRARLQGRTARLAAGNVTLAAALARMLASAGLANENPPAPEIALPALPPLTGALPALLAQVCVLAGMTLAVDDNGEWVLAAAVDAPAIDTSSVIESLTEQAGSRHVIVQGGPPLVLSTIREWQAVLPMPDGGVQPLSQVLKDWGIPEIAARRACLSEGGFAALVGTAPNSAERIALLKRFAFRVFKAPGDWLPVGGVDEHGRLLSPQLKVRATRAKGVAPLSAYGDAFEDSAETRALEAFELDLERGLLYLHEPPYITVGSGDPTRQGRRLTGTPGIALTIARLADAPAFTHESGDGPDEVIHAPQLIEVRNESGAVLNRAHLVAAATSLARAFTPLPRQWITMAGVPATLAAGTVARLLIIANEAGLTTRLEVQAPQTPALPATALPPTAGDAVTPDQPRHQPINAFREGPLVLAAHGNVPEGEAVLAMRAHELEHRTGALLLDQPGALALPYFLASEDAAQFGRWFFVAGCEATEGGRVRVLAPDGRHAEVLSSDFAQVRKARPEGLRGLLVSLGDEPVFVDAGPLVSDARGRKRGDASNLVSDLDGSRLSPRKRGGLQLLTVLALSPVHKAAGVGGGAPGWAPVLNFRDGKTGARHARGRGLFAEGTGHDLGRLAASGNGGPVLADSRNCGKHLYGSASDDDGQYRESAGHISTEAFYKVPGDPVHDAPLAFVPQPFVGDIPPWPPFEAQIKYHAASTHQWDGKLRPGRWRIQYRVPFYPEIPPTWKPPTRPPTDDPPVDDPPRVHVPAMLKSADDVNPAVTENNLWAPSHDWVPAPTSRDEREVPFPGPSIKSEGWAGEVNGIPDVLLGGGCIYLPPGRGISEVLQDSGQRSTWLLLHPEVALGFGAPGVNGAAKLLQGWAVQLAQSGHHLELNAHALDGSIVDDNARGVHVNGYLRAGRPDAAYGEQGALRLGEGAQDGICFGPDTVLYRDGESCLATAGDFAVGGKLTVDGLIDPTGLELAPVAANPGGTAANTLWLDNSDSNRLKLGATRVTLASDLGSVASEDIVPVAKGGTGYAGGAYVFAQLQGELGGITPALDDVLLARDTSGSTLGGYLPSGLFTLQALYNLINSLTAEAAPVAADKIPIYDASGSQTDAVTWANLIAESKAVVIDWDGNGSSGRTVTLTGINRAHFMINISDDNTGTRNPAFAGPDGATGTIVIRSSSGAADNRWSLNAPAAGTSQVLTINTTGSENASGVGNKLLVIGTPI